MKMFLHKKSKSYNKYTKEFIEAYLERVAHGKIIWSVSMAQYTLELILIMICTYDETLKDKLDDRLSIIDRFMQAMELEHFNYEVRRIEFKAADEVGYILMNCDSEFDVKHLEKYYIQLQYNVMKDASISWKINRCYFKTEHHPKDYRVHYPSEHKLKRREE
jgi:hypothetical protein